jgi:hypothetical protein
MPQQQHDPNRPEDVLKLGVAEDGNVWDGDDAADETRYALMSRFSKTKAAKKEPEIDRYGMPIKRKKSFMPLISARILLMPFYSPLI